MPGQSGHSLADWVSQSPYHHIPVSHVYTLSYLTSLYQMIEHNCIVTTFQAEVKKRGSCPYAFPKSPQTGFSVYSITKYALVSVTQQSAKGKQTGLRESNKKRTLLFPTFFCLASHITYINMISTLQRKRPPLYATYQPARHLEDTGTQA